MKRLIFSALALAACLAANACPVCERQQPKLLKGIVHGAGPESSWDYLPVWLTVIISVVALFYSLKWLLKPGEKSRSHIKYSILND